MRPCYGCIHHLPLVRNGQDVEGCGRGGWDRAAVWERDGKVFPEFDRRNRLSPVANCGPDAIFYEDGNPNRLAGVTPIPVNLPFGTDANGVSFPEPNK